MIVRSGFLFFIGGLLNPLLILPSLAIGLVSPGWFWAVLGGIAGGGVFVQFMVPEATLPVWIGTCLAAPVWSAIGYRGKQLFRG